jgi:DNA-binding transcriptional LysR family regulator
MTALTVSRLKCLRELAFHGSIAAAAEALWLTPSAVSQQLATLQRETNVQLIERSGRGVTLTAAGRTLVEHAERVFSALEEAEAALGAFNHEPMGCLRVAILPSLVRLALTVMEAMRTEHAGLTFEIEDLETDESLAALDGGRVDVAIVDQNDWTVAKRRCVGMQAVELFADPLVAAYTPSHQLASRPTLRWDDLAPEPWIIGQPTWSFLGPVFERCRAAGFEPSVVARVRDRSAALGLIRQGWGIAVLPTQAVAGQSEGVAWRGVEPTLYRTTVAVTRTTGADVPAVRSLIERLRAEAGDQAGAEAECPDAA